MGFIMKLFSIILEGSTEKEAMEWASGFAWCDCETTEQAIKYKRYIGSDNGIGVWYDYGADYYFFEDETEDNQHYE